MNDPLTFVPAASGSLTAITTPMFSGSYSAGIEISRSLDWRTNTLISGPSIAAPTKARSERTPLLKLVRRMHGFFLGDEGNEAKVAFVDHGELVYYTMPAALFLRAGVRHSNQPFQMDEVVAEVDGVALRGYRVVASARPDAAYLAKLELDPDLQEELNTVRDNLKDVES